jgi:DNA-binding IclR family transcriptional regulator
LRSRIADVLDQHPEGLSVDKLADAVNLDKGKIARVLRALSIKGCFKEGNMCHIVVENSF